MSTLSTLLLVLTIAATAEQAMAPLPAPKGLDAPLGSLFEKRHSTRSFDSSRPVTREQLGTLLWAAVGITRPEGSHPQGGKRTSPSAFGSGSVDVYVTSTDGTYVYAGREHALRKVADDDLREKLGGADWAQKAPCVLLLVADLSRYPERVPPEDRGRYAYADAAAAGENLYLAATALGLGTVLTVNSNPDAAKALGLEANHKVVFVFPVGYEK